MEAYIDFVGESFLVRDVGRARRQKELEERITRPFSLKPRLERSNE
jgi:hypothetical protein